MALQFERKIPLISFFVFLILTTVGFLLYQNTVSVQQAIQWEKHTQEIVSALDENLTLTLDADAGVDSFVLSGNDTYLEQYNKAKQKIERNTARLRALGSSNPAMAAELDTQAALVKQFFDGLAQKVAIRKSEGFDVAVAGLVNSSETTLLSQLRVSIDRAKASELTLLEGRERQLDDALSRTVLVLIFSCLAGIASLGVANLIVFRETRKRSNAETELKDTNRDLELRIDERTTELLSANEHLESAAGEREDLLKREHKARLEAEIANRLRDEFMATVSHELRTPLNSMLGWARLLKAGSLSHDQEQRAVETIIKNSEIQNRLIEDLMDV
ncbi:MAG TPA: CHASE3 domain-containing protein, partial [Pyrinomonadaceae bacterium]|nr:CHASE3 domain-containing protein [Pyrinomonadaceae bacterium]